MKKITFLPILVILALIFSINVILGEDTLAAKDSAKDPIIFANFNIGTGKINDQVFGQGMEIPFLKNIWDKDTGFDQDKIEVTKSMGFTNIRFGGNTCKSFDWRNSGFESYGKTYYENIDQWATYASLLGNTPLTICVNLNLSPEDSADLLKYANIEKGYNIINWEMGNEEYLRDQYQSFNTADDYVRSARAHCNAMKEVDSRIKCGIHTGTDFYTDNPDWTDYALFKAIQPGEFDFIADHNYQPNDYFNSYAIYSDIDKIEKHLNLSAGNYRITFQGKGDQAPSNSDPIPTLKACLDSACEIIDINSQTTWNYYSSALLGVEDNSNVKITMEIVDDYYDYETKEDKNIYIAEIKIVDQENSVVQAVALKDSVSWTYSFLASNLSMENRLDILKNTQNSFGLNLPIYETEYGWYYGYQAYPGEGKQYDWRSGLFDGLQLQSLIRKEVQQANIWTDLDTANWKFYSNDAKGEIYWPRYHVFKLMREKVGNTIVDVKTQNMPTYNAEEFSTEARENVPYLSVFASKGNNKNYINVINRHQNDSINAIIKSNGNYSAVTVYEIAPSSIESHPYRNDEYREDIAIDKKIIAIKNNFNYNFKPFSITTFEFSASVSQNSQYSNPSTIRSKESIKWELPWLKR